MGMSMGPRFPPAIGCPRCCWGRADVLPTNHVTGTGRGLEPEALTRIFDLYFQVRPADGEGLGIGLSVVREIVTLHRGLITARSEGHGLVSEFTVTLPLATMPSAVQWPPNPHEANEEMGAYSRTGSRP